MMTPSTPAAFCVATWRAENEPQPQHPRPDRSTAKSAVRNNSLALQGRDVSCTVPSITKRLAEPGPSAIPYLIFHFFTEYNAPRRGPSGMFAARDCPAPLSSTEQGVRSLSVLPIA